MISAVCFLHSLRFSNTEQEHAFAKSRMPAVVKNLRMGSMLLMVVVLFGLVFVMMSGRFSGPHQEPTLYVLGVNGLTICISLGLFFYLRKSVTMVYDDGTPSIATTTLCPEQCERLGVLLALWATLVAYGASIFRISRLFGLDPEEAFKIEDACFLSDSSLLLALDCVVTAVALFLPIRVHILVVVPIAVVSSFVVSSLFLGSPDGTKTVMMNIIFMMLLSIMAVLGCHQNEARERDRFIEVSEVRKEMVEERVARFDLEHQLEQSSVVKATHVGTHSSQQDDGDQRLQQSAEMTELSFELSASKPSETSSSHNPPMVVGSKTESEDVASQLAAKACAPLIQNECAQPPVQTLDRGQCQKPSPNHLTQQEPSLGESRESPSAPLNTPESLPESQSDVLLTPEQTRLYHIKEVVRAWSLHPASSPQCCALHAGLQAAHDALHIALDWSCDYEWKPFSAGQCATCYSLLPSLKMQFCDVCGDSVWPKLGTGTGQDRQFSDPSLISLSQIDASGSVSTFEPRDEPQANTPRKADGNLHSI